ncbi:MAG TPA: sodium:solute symporter family protein [Verrucomicrobiae bacterium]|jgi:SSS family solute:Na+ symporter|nr:sodium:solute symporter family protein [Verrucomicrobiae bacterium]
MIPVIVLFVYLAIIVCIGLFAFKKGQANTEDFFLANRTIGPMVFFLSLFATNMTAFAILGSSGLAYRRGIGIYGLMASSSGFVIPLTIFFIGTRLWALGKRFGHQTQVQFFRARWECDAIGTLIFVLSAAMLIPYMIISIMGGGTVLQEISTAKDAVSPLIPYWLGCAIVAVVVTINVFFGGMRGTVWVNIFQTILFLCFGFIAMIVISRAFPGGFGEVMAKLGANPKTHFLLTRERMPEAEFWSYTLIPLSSIMFPHMAIMCFSARKVSAFKRTVVIYPIAILLIWLPCIFLGVIGAQAIPGLKDADGILLRLLNDNAPAWLAGLLGAGIISAVMGSDAHQVLAMSTMFTKDIYVHYGGHKKYGERAAVYFARSFIVVVTLIAYVIALYLKSKQGIFEIAIRFAFSGFAAMAPVMVAALFWKRSTKWGAFASTLFVGATLIGFALLQGKPAIPPAPPAKIAEGHVVHAPGETTTEHPAVNLKLDTNALSTNAVLTAGIINTNPLSTNAPDLTTLPLVKTNAPVKVATAPTGAPPAPKMNVIWKVGDHIILSRSPATGDVRFWNSTTNPAGGYMTVVPMVFGSALCMIIFSLLTRPPSDSTIEKYFSDRNPKQS